MPAFSVAPAASNASLSRGMGIGKRDVSKEMCRIAVDLSRPHAPSGITIRYCQYACRFLRQTDTPSLEREIHAARKGVVAGSRRLLAVRQAIHSFIILQLVRPEAFHRQDTADSNTTNI